MRQLLQERRICFNLIGSDSRADTDDELSGRKIADSVWAIYASENYIAQRGKPANIDDLRSTRWSAWIER